MYAVSDQRATDEPHAVVPRVSTRQRRPDHGVRPRMSEEVMRRRCGGDAAAMRRRCGGDAAAMRR
jgi:hypothetical protein